MRGLRLSLAVCMGVIACTKVENRERPAEDRSPYGELEIARADEALGRFAPRHPTLAELEARIRQARRIRALLYRLSKLGP